MAFPAQKTAPNLSEVPENPPIFDVSSTEGSPARPEAVSAIGKSQPSGDNKTIQQPSPSDTNENVPKPGKIVDKSVNHKEKITTLSTTDTITLEADEVENEFIPKVEEAHDTAHEQHN